MKFLLFLALLGLATAMPQLRSKDADIQNLRTESENNEDGSFRWAYENSDGARQDQSGYIKNPQEPDPEQRIQVIQGSYSYYTPEGIPVSITYTADENGYQAQGDAIPTSPPIPEAIQKALDIIYRNAEAQRNNPNPNPNRRF